MIKPCPFCGKNRIVFQRNFETLEIENMYCLSCKVMVRFTDIKPKSADTFGATQQEWEDRWNRRKGL